ncbi:tensin-3-like [Lytechinus variegatus]|uniref:tensin-3-like n=1 Tax=Lytechinus variegatus TaxID=7654 RepID=UPI001BB0E8D8|nr:tensin-3-like [Lytechinus variegatus]
MAKEVKHLAWKLNCYKVMTTCLPQSPTISPEGKYIFGSSPSENRRKKPSSSPSTPTTPTPPSTPRLPHTPATARKMQQLDESPKLQPVQSIMQQSTVQIQHAPPPPQQQQPQQRIQQQQHQPQQLIQHQMQPQTIQTKSISIKSGDGLVRYSFDLEVDYITERLIAVSFPSGGLENQYRSNLRDVVRMLKSKHNNCYVVFNLSRRRHDVSKLNQEVRDLGWPNVLAPPLERLCSICKQIETWMKGNLNNVVVLHCKGGRGPIGVVVSAFMNYLSITSGNDSTMDRHAMKRFLDAKGWGSMHPSQMRYIDYFSGLLTNSIQINSSPLFLHHAVIHGVPNYDSNGGCRPFLRVYQGMSPVYTSGVYTVPEGTSRFVITPGRAIPLRGDILLKCYHKKFRSTTRDTIFRCQFHTTAVMEYRLVFQKQELDDACTDARFPEFTKVELIFSSTPDALHGSDYVSGASFPSEHIDDPLIRWDSYEHFNDIIEGPEGRSPLWRS